MSKQNATFITKNKGKKKAYQEEVTTEKKKVISGRRIFVNVVERSSHWTQNVYISYTQKYIKQE